MKTIKLKNCPFCGTDALEYLSSDGYFTYVSCLECGLTGPQAASGYSSAVLWNLLPRGDEKK